MRPGSVRLRLTLWGIAVLTSVLMIFGGVLRYQMQSDILRSVDADMAHFGHDMARPFGERGGPLGRPGPPFLGGPDDEFGKTGPPPHSDNNTPQPPRFDRGPGERGPGRHGPPGGGPDDNGGPPDQEHTGWRTAPLRMTPRFLTLAGKPIAPTTSGGAWDETTFQQSAESGSEVYSTVRINGEPLRILSLPRRNEQGRIIGVVQLARPLADLQWSLDRLTRSLLLLIIPCLLIAGAGGAFLTDRVLAPVRHITVAASQIEAQDLSGRLPVTGGDEFAELARTFNGMLARLESAFAQQQRFVADASHELKTPLAAIKVHTGLALSKERTPEQYQQTLRTVDRSVDAATRIVQDLLLLARSDTQALQLHRTPTHLADILHQAVETVTAAHQHRSTKGTSQPSPMPTITVDLPESLPEISGDGHYLTRLFTNLLENAVRYTPPEGKITVTATPEENQITLHVTDTGEGIAPEHLPHLCERFYRVDDSRTRASGGVGLGLAICQSIAQAHGGTLNIQSTPNVGTTVSVTLPRG